MAKNYVSQHTYDNMKGVVNEKWLYEEGKREAEKAAEAARAATGTTPSATTTSTPTTTTTSSASQSLLTTGWNGMPVTVGSPAARSQTPAATPQTPAATTTPTVDTSYESHYEAAKPYYGALAGTGYDVALQGMDWEQANDYFSDFAVARDEKTILSDIRDKKYGYEDAKAKGADYSQYDASELYAELASVNPTLAGIVSNWDYNTLTTFLETGKLPTISVPSPSESYGSATPTKSPNELVTDNNAFISDYGKQGLDTVQYMYTAPEYGSWVSDYFMTHGNAKGAQAEAGAAAENGGNLDSFARYNKDATNLGYAIAGQDAVQKMREGYARDYSGMLNTAGNLLNENAVDFYDYTSDIYNTTKTTDAERYSYDKDAEIAAAEIAAAEKAAAYEAAYNNAVLAEDRRQFDATLKAQGYNPNGTVAVPNGTSVAGSAVGGIVNGGNSTQKAGANYGSGGDFTVDYEEGYGGNKTTGAINVETYNRIFNGAKNGDDLSGTVSPEAWNTHSFYVYDPNQENYVVSIRSMAKAKNVKGAYELAALAGFSYETAKEIIEGV